MILFHVYLQGCIPFGKDRWRSPPLPSLVDEFSRGHGENHHGPWEWRGDRHRFLLDPFQVVFALFLNYLNLNAFGSCRISPNLFSNSQFFQSPFVDVFLTFQGALHSQNFKLPGSTRVGDLQKRKKWAVSQTNLPNVKQNKQTNKQTNKQRNKQIKKQTNKQTNKETKKETNKETNKQTNKQTNKRTNEQTNKQTTENLNQIKPNKANKHKQTTPQNPPFHCPQVALVRSLYEAGHISNGHGGSIHKFYLSKKAG